MAPENPEHLWPVQSIARAAVQCQQWHPQREGQQGWAPQFSPVWPQFGPSTPKDPGLTGLLQFAG